MPAEESGQAVENNYVGIGWPAMGDIFVIEASRKAFKKALPKA